MIPTSGLEEARKEDSFSPDQCQADILKITDGLRPILMEVERQTKDPVQPPAEGKFPEQNPLPKGLPQFLHAEALRLQSACRNFEKSTGQNPAQAIDEYHSFLILLDRLIFLQIQPEVIRLWLPLLPGKQNTKKYAGLSLLKMYVLLNAPVFPECWPVWTASFCHVFPSSYARIPRDVDNYDYKPLIDFLAMELGTSDSAMRFSMSATTKLTDDSPSGTYVEITPKCLDFSLFKIQV